MVFKEIEKHQNIVNMAVALCGTIFMYFFFRKPRKTIVFLKFEKNKIL